MSKDFHHGLLPVPVFLNAERPAGKGWFVIFPSDPGAVEGMAFPAAEVVAGGFGSFEKISLGTTTPFWSSFSINEGINPIA